MKFWCVLIYFAMVSHYLAQHTTDQRQLDLGGEILHEIRILKDKICSMDDKMDSMEDEIKSLKSQCPLGAPCNCQELMRKGFLKNGLYNVYVHINEDFTKSKQIKVYCDMETDGGGWLVFQRRTDGSENFYRGWNDYKDGFGDLANEFWLGNENLYQILNTCGDQHELRIDLEDFNNETRYANYETFNIENQGDNYRLRLGTYFGDATDSLRRQDGHQFTTFDNDNDVSSKNCAELYKGAWWYDTCHESNLNGLYLNGSHSTYADGVNWRHWKGYRYSLKFTEMKIRPK